MYDLIMNTSILVRVGLVILALTVFSVGGVLASDDDANAKGIAVLTALATRYASAHSYSGVAQAKAEGVFTGLTDVREETTRLAFDRRDEGSRFAIETQGTEPGSIALYDGTAFYAYYAPLAAYTKTTGAEATRQAEQVGLGPMGGIVFELLRSNSKIDAFCADPKSVAWLRSETVDSVSADVVTFQAKGRGTATVWIDADGRLLREDYDLMPILRARAEASPNAKALPDAVKMVKESKLTVSITHEGIEIDKPVDEARFCFTPPPDAKQVAEFDESAEAPDWMRMTRRLVGKPIPNIPLETIDGKKQSTCDLFGAPTILYFGAAWLTQSATYAEVLAKLAEEHKSRLVIIAEDPTEEIRAAFGPLLKSERIIAVRDIDGLIAEKLEVIGIPAAIVIDAEGIVRAQLQGDETVDDVRKALDQLSPKSPE